MIEEAVCWYRKAAKQGHSTAQNNLGVMYRDGHGVVQDLVMAYVWLSVSVANGLVTVANGRDHAAEDRDKVLTRLNASERMLALELSKLCFRKPAKCPEYSDD